jgi:hypothetical protein
LLAKKQNFTQRLPWTYGGACQLPGETMGRDFLGLARRLYLFDVIFVSEMSFKRLDNVIDTKNIFGLIALRKNQTYINVNE